MKYFTLSTEELCQLYYVIGELECYYPEHECDDGFQSMIDSSREFLREFLVSNTQ